MISKRRHVSRELLKIIEGVRAKSIMVDSCLFITGEA